MITPGLLRRSMVRAAQWRLLALQLLLLALAGFVAVHPWFGFLGKQLDHHPQASKLAAALGSRGIVELVQRAGSQDGWHPEISFFNGLLLTMLFAPLFAGAVLAVSRSDEPLHSRELLEGAGSFLGRMLRAGVAALMPLAILGGLAGIAFKLAGTAEEKAITEAQGNHAMHLANVAGLIAFVLASIWLDAGRAMFAAQPKRRSAFFATWAGFLLMVRRPLRALAIGLTTMILSLGLAAVVMVLRERIVQDRGYKVFLALLLSQLALVILAWGRASRLLGFVELARADTLARAKPAGTFEMAPPRTSPPAPQDQSVVAVSGVATQAVFAMAPPEDPLLHAEKVFDAVEHGQPLPQPAKPELVAVQQVDVTEVQVTPAAMNGAAGQLVEGVVTSEVERAVELPGTGTGTGAGMENAPGPGAGSGGAI